MRWKEERMERIKTVKIVKRGRSYQLYYYNLRGERRRLSVGSDYKQAQCIATKFTEWLLEGKDPERVLRKAQMRKEKNAITLRDLYPIFMERHGKSRSYNMQLSYESSFKNICRCPSLINTEIDFLSKSLVLDYMHTRIKNDSVKAATVNREAAFIKCMLSKASEWDIIDINPLEGLKLLQEAEKRDVYLTVEQAQVLLNTLPDPIADIVEFAIYTGFRKENILSLRIESVRFHDLTSTGEAMLSIKGGRTELFPLGPTSIDLLKRVIGERIEGYVFINPQTQSRYVSIHKTFDRVVRKLGLTVNGTKLRIHDLRHVFATWLHREGVSLDALRPLMGHKNRATTDRYTTIDRLAVGKLLSYMPRIRNFGNEKALTTKTPRPNLTHTDTGVVMSS